MLIRPFRREDTEAVIALWEACELTRPWNDPRKDIERKVGLQPDLFLVGCAEDAGDGGGAVVASVMVGYDGHRGWINYLAVAPERRRTGLARALVAAAEERLVALGCPKVNLQVRDTNTEAMAFWESLGFVPDKAVALGRRLIPDD